MSRHDEAEGIQDNREKLVETKKKVAGFLMANKRSYGGRGFANDDQEETPSRKKEKLHRERTRWSASVSACADQDRGSLYDRLERGQARWAGSGRDRALPTPLHLERPAD